MYVPYDVFNDEWSSAGISEQEYEQLAPIADLLIDDWTLDRVGNAVNHGVMLPKSIITLYSLIIKNVPTYLKDATASGSKVASFSNGIDSYTFSTDETMTISSMMRSALDWYVCTLPIGWISAVASEYGKYPE